MGHSHFNLAYGMEEGDQIASATWERSLTKKAGIPAEFTPIE
jgi:hypothetical protein